MRLAILLLLLITTPLQAGNLRKAFVLHVNGIGGHRSIDDALVRGLKLGGVGETADVVDWTTDTPWLAGLAAFKANQIDAQSLADRIVAFHENSPQTPIVLTAHSAGAGIVTWALEKLPDGVTVDAVVMVAPALSPDYDLSAALAHVAGPMLVLTSSRDRVVLQAGTMQFGTVDRKFVPAMGFAGVTQPDAADAAQYAKIVEMPYLPEWKPLGNDGGHMGPMRTRFARDVIAKALIEATSPLPPATQPAGE